MAEAKKLVLRLGGVFALLALLAGGIWLALPHIVRTIIHVAAERNGLESLVVDVESVRWDHAVIRRLAFAVETANGPVAVEVGGLTARYQLTAMALTAATAESGAVTWRQQPAQQPTPATTALPRVPPLRVKRMELSIHSQWGISTFNGELDLAERAHQIALRLSDDRQSLQLVADPGLRSATVRIAANGEPVARLEVTDPMAVNTTLDGDVHVHRLRSWSQGNPLVPEAARAVLPQLAVDHGLLSVHGQLTQQAGQYAFEGRGQSTWRGWRQQGMVLSGHIDFRLHVKNNEWQLTALPKSRLQLADVRWGDDKAAIRIPKAEFDIEAEIRTLLGDGGWRITVDPFVARTSALEVFLDPETAVRTQQLRLTGRLVPSHEHNRVELRASALRPSLPSLQVTADSLKADAVFDTDRQLRAKGTFSAAGVRMRDWPETMNTLSLTGRFDHRDRVITALGDAHIGQKKIARWRLEPKGRSETSLSTNFEADAATMWPYVKPLVDKNWKQLSLASGALSGDAQLTWNSRTTGTMTLRGKGINGRHEDAEFTDLDIELTSKDMFAADYDVRIRIERARTAGGIVMSDAGIEFHWRDDTIDLGSASLYILGGKFIVEPTILKLGGSDLRLPVGVADLDFGRVLAMIDQRGLSGSGRLDGTIPIAFVGDAVEITDAELHSTVPGTLRYRAGGEAAAPTDNIALMALQDFHYDTMKIRINYEPDGAYRVRLRLEGRNPNLYNGYPIAFNLNLSGELPGLLRAGILTGDFSKQILKDIRSDQ